MPLASLLSARNITGLNDPSEVASFAMSVRAILTPQSPEVSLRRIMVVAGVIIRATLAVVFVAAVIGKVRGREAFRAFLLSLGETGVIPSFLVIPLGTGITLLESVSAILLLLPNQAETGLLLASATLAVLTAGVVAVVTKRRSVTCNCFGAQGSVLALRHVVRNGTLLSMSVLGFFAFVGSPEMDGMALLALFAGLLLGICIVNWDDVAFVIAGAA